ncbi:MAG: helix-turn-helix transcriptional regulator [Ideonella sp.]|nr:helix-turn-helix transcriptional regulator [Ideonella sp.]MCC7458588.1 helix-turn-helix transcriptional regulator [Nitrospira sp.]
MRDDLAPSVVQRTLFDGEWLQIGYVAVRPRSSGCGELESSALNVLALPLAGVFAKHDGPRRHAIATPQHALLIRAGAPYRLSFPGCVGDRCLALRFTPAALAQAMPEAMSADGFDEAAFAGHTALPPAALLARSALWRRLASDAVDALETEERAAGLLEATLAVARRQWPARTRGRVVRAGSWHRARHVARAVEAIATEPQRRWTLGTLGALASVSPGHLAHLFRAELGVSVYDFVVRSRLSRALDAVLDSDAGLTEIALDAGFASHSHFTARFRAFYGHTPQQLRRDACATTVRELRRIATAPQAFTA